MKRERVLIMGAAGRDFHNFNVAYREREDIEVVAFTAAQIPGIDRRRYPPALAGRLYPEGIPIVSESRLETLVRELAVDRVVFAYSDVSHEAVMHAASRALAAGADFEILGPRTTFLRSILPVVAVCAARTGCGKSQTSRYLMRKFCALGMRTVAIRHPMPYGDLARQRVERIASYADLDRYECTLEEREEYESYVEAGAVVFAGVDYRAILAEAEREADILLWDGGNNDLPFVEPKLWVTVVDPLRPGHAFRYHPGEANVRAADVLVVNKSNSAAPEVVASEVEALREANPRAEIVRAASEVFVDDAAAVRGQRVLVVDDGPTLTHGGMPYGAARVAAESFGAAEIVDPRPFAVGSLAQTFAAFPQLERALPAMGYSREQLADLEETIRRVPCDLVLVGTPIDLARVIRVPQRTVRVRYELADAGSPTLGDVVSAWWGGALHGGAVSAPGSSPKGDG
jgi:predicted GTPase